MSEEDRYFWAIFAGGVFGLALNLAYYIVSGDVVFMVISLVIFLVLGFHVLMNRK